MSGTAHSHFGLWTTWRRGPDVLGHVADVVADHVDAEATVELRYGDDIESAASGAQLAARLTGQGLSDFQSILITGCGQRLRVRVAFVRRPMEVLVGANDARRARVRGGVVLEVSSDDPSCGDEVARAKDALAAAIERGHPSLVLRPPRHGRARRRDEQHPDGEPGSASALLERTIRGWPRRSAFSVMFVLVALALYAGVIALLATVDFPFLYDGETLDLGLPAVRWIVAVLALAVPAGAIWLQPRLFPAVEVATLTSARRALRLLGSWASIPVVAGAITQLPFVADLFK